MPKSEKLRKLKEKSLKIQIESITDLEELPWDDPRQLDEPLALTVMGTSSTTVRIFRDGHPVFEASLPEGFTFFDGIQHVEGDLDRLKTYDLLVQQMMEEEAHGVRPLSATELRTRLREIRKGRGEG